MTLNCLFFSIQYDGNLNDETSFELLAMQNTLKISVDAHAIINRRFRPTVLTGI